MMVSPIDPEKAECFCMENIFGKPSPTAIPLYSNAMKAKKKQLCADSRRSPPCPPSSRSGKRPAAAARKRQWQPSTQTGTKDLNWKLPELENMREKKQLKNTQATNDHHWSWATKRSRGAQLALTQGQRDAIAKRQHHLVHALICQEALVESPCTLAVHTQLLPH